MNLSRTPVALVFVLAMSAADVTAQQTRYVPQFRNVNHRYTSSVFARPQARQQILLGDEFCSSFATVSSFAFRRDFAFTTNYASRAVPVRAWMSSWRSTNAQFSNTFASNRNSPRTLVSSGTVVLPALPYGNIQFLVRFPLATPYLYTRSTGKLMLELEAGSTSFNNYFLDGYNDWTRVRSREFLSGGRFRSGEQSWLRFYDGGEIGEDTTVLIAEHLRSPYPTVLAVGTDPTNYAGLRLPLNLAPFGAPGNTLGTSIDFALPVALTSVDAWGATVDVAIPFLEALGDKSIYMQAIHVDPTSNALGLVLSNALEVRIKPYYPFWTLTGSMTDATGKLHNAAVSVELSGVFQ